MATSLEKWESITQSTRIVKFFENLFERVGVRVTDTGEVFTCHHRGGHIELEPTLDESKVDYTVEIESFQVDRLVEHTRTGEIDEVEQYRVVRALFTPATAATLKHPMMSNLIIRIFLGIEDLIHVYLKSPVPEAEDVNHTLTYVKGQWLAIPGLHGRPGRTYRLTMDDALTYHKQAFLAIKANKWSQWMKFSRWYRRWRKTVSTRP